MKETDDTVHLHRKAWKSGTFRPNLRTDRYETCPDLRATIQQATLNGTVQVVATE